MIELDLLLSTVLVNTSYWSGCLFHLGWQSCCSPVVVACRRVAQLVADVGNLCGREAVNSHNQKGSCVKTERWEAERDARLKPWDTRRVETETQVCGAAADLWLTPCRPNSDRISFITAEEEIYFLINNCYDIHVNSWVYIWIIGPKLAILNMCHPLIYMSCQYIGNFSCCFVVPVIRNPCVFVTPWIWRAAFPHAWLRGRAELTNTHMRSVIRHS